MLYRFITILFLFLFIHAAYADMLRINYNVPGINRVTGKITGTTDDPWQRIVFNNTEVWHGLLSTFRYEYNGQQKVNRGVICNQNTCTISITPYNSMQNTKIHIYVFYLQPGEMTFEHINQNNAQSVFDINHTNFKIFGNNPYDIVVNRPNASRPSVSLYFGVTGGFNNLQASINNQLTLTIINSEKIEDIRSTLNIFSIERQLLYSQNYSSLPDTIQIDTINGTPADYEICSRFGCLRRELGENIILEQHETIVTIKDQATLNIIDKANVVIKANDSPHYPLASGISNEQGHFRFIHWNRPISSLNICVYKQGYTQRCSDFPQNKIITMSRPVNTPPSENDTSSISFGFENRIVNHSPTAIISPPCSKSIQQTIHSDTMSYSFINTCGVTSGKITIKKDNYYQLLSSTFQINAPIHNLILRHWPDQVIFLIDTTIHQGNHFSALKRGLVQYFDANNAWNQTGLYAYYAEELFHVNGRDDLLNLSQNIGEAVTIQTILRKAIEKFNDQRGGRKILTILTNSSRFSLASTALMDVNNYTNLLQERTSINFIIIGAQVDVNEINTINNLTRGQIFSDTNINVLDTINQIINSEVN